MFDPSAVFYMNKIAVGPDAVDAIDITAPIGENIRRVAKAKSVSVSDVTVCILDRPRHETADRRCPGCRRPDPAHLRRRRRGRDLGVPARTPAPTCWSGSAARRRASSPPPRIRCMGGAIQGQLAPQGRRRAPEGDRRAATTSTRCCSPTTWSPATTCSSAPPASPTATCSRASTTTAAAAPRSRSSCARKSGTVRMIEAYHRLSKAQRILRDRFHRRQQRRIPAAITNH